MRHHRNILLLFIFISNCQYFGAEPHKDSITLTTVVDTKYQQHIKTINTCLESVQEQPLSDPETKDVEVELQQRDAEGTIKPARYGSICANYSSGTIASERVRRCLYQLDIYPAAAISHCIKQARADTTRVKPTQWHVVKSFKPSPRKLMMMQK